MSALGQDRTFNEQTAMSAVPPRVDIRRQNVRYALLSGRRIAQTKTSAFGPKRTLGKSPDRVSQMAHPPVNALASGLVQDRTLPIHLIGLPDRHGRSNALSASAVTVASDAVGFHVGSQRDVLKKAVEPR